MMFTTRRSRRSFLAILALAAACGGENGPKPATTVAASSATSFEGVVATAVSPKPAVKVTDADGVGVANVPVLFAATAGGGIAGGATATTNADGIATIGAWTLGPKTGGNTLTASAAGLTGSPVTFTATAAAGAPAVVTVFSGNGQSGVVGSTLPIAPSVKVVDAHENPVPDVSVTFTVGSGGGSATGTAAVTNASGIATVGSWTLGTEPGPNSLVASVAGTGAAPIMGTVNATATEAQTPARIFMVGGDRQAVMAGSAVPVKPSVKVTDANGAPIAGVLVTFAVSSGAGQITGASVRSDASGVAAVGSWTLGSAGMLNTLTASVEGSGVVGNPVEINASGCTGGGTGYRMTLCFVNAMSASRRAIFATAAAKWESVITSELADRTLQSGFSGGQCSFIDYSLPAGTAIDDLLIFASVESIDGTSGTLAQAGPCLRRGTAFGELPLIGQMRFDEADVAGMELDGSLNSVIQHEMGHVLGIGTLWQPYGLLANASSTGSVNDTHFTGANAIAGFDAIGFSSYTGAKVPVENMFGSGTVNSHWRESILDRELMTGFIERGGTPNPMTLLTIRSLQDLGYTVDTGNADPFSAPPAAVAERADRPKRQLLNDIHMGPQYALDSRGRLVRIR